MVRSASVLLRGRPEDGSPSPLSPDAGWGNHRNIDYRHRRSVARYGSCMLTRTYLKIPDCCRSAINEE